MHGSGDPQAGTLDRTGHVQTSATGEDKYVSREIGAANAGVQIKFSAGGNRWIPATGVFGAMSGADNAQVQQAGAETPALQCREQVASRREWLGASRAG